MQVDEVDLHLPSAQVHRAAELHFALGFAAWINEMATQHGDLMTAYALDFARWTGEYAHPGAQLEKIEIEAALYPPLGELLEDYDALLCPTCGARGLVAGDDYVGHGLDVGGRHLEHYFVSMLTPTFNILSRCPVLVVPGGFADNGLPVGVQIVGRTYDDVVPFRLGAALEQVRPWLDAAERRPAIAQEAPAT